MTNPLSQLALAALSLSLGASSLACSSSSGSSTTDAASSDGNVSDTGSSGDTTVTPPGDSGPRSDADNPPPSEAACADYCAMMDKSCTGANAQYEDVDCNILCTKLAAWPTGAAGATSGNTLACRVTYAKAAASDPAKNCGPAGKFGAGICGGRCEGFCRLSARNCTGKNQIYTDDAACMATCNGWPTDKQECSIYHLGLAGEDPVTHCPHGSPTSHACG